MPDMWNSGPHTMLAALHCRVVGSMWKWGEGGWWDGHNASTVFYHRASIKSLAHNMYSNIGHSRKEYVMMGFRCPGHTKCNSPSFCFHMHQTNSQRHNLEHYCTIDQASKGLYTFLCILQHLRQLWWDWVNCSAVLQQIHHTLNGSLSWAESAGGDQVPPCPTIPDHHVYLQTVPLPVQRLQYYGTPAFWGLNATSKTFTPL